METGNCPIDSLGLEKSRKKTKKRRVFRDNADVV